MIDAKTEKMCVTEQSWKAFRNNAPQATCDLPRWEFFVKRYDIVELSLRAHGSERLLANASM
jgi:hypothetical protein